MALEKMSVPINFSQGLDLKTDPKQVTAGKFLALSNSIFDKGGLLQKRNGFSELTNLSVPNLNTLDTYNGNLTAIGQSLYAFSMDSEQWIDKGVINSVTLDVLPLVRAATSQNTVDVAIASSGLTCVVWEDSGGTSNYSIVDSSTGQVIVPNTTLESGAATPRVFNLGNYFVITYLKVISATTHLRYTAISTNNVNFIVPPTDISTQVSSISAAYDGQIVVNTLYIAWNGSDGGGAVRFTSINAALLQNLTRVIAGHNALFISVCGDTSGSFPFVWVSFGDSSNNGWTAMFSSILSPILTATATWTGVVIYNLTSFATGNVNTIYYETNNDYSFESVRSDFISSITVTSTGTVGSPIIILRSVGLASKAFQINNITYMLAAYNGSFQPTYFLIDGSGNILGKLAYSNGGGYPSTQILSNAIVNGSQVQIGYLFKDTLTAVNKNQTGAIGGLYSQLGINLATFNLAIQAMVSSEISGTREFASGFVWMYDGVKPVELGFHLWPEDIGFSDLTTGGSLTAQIYFYQVTYEWTDSQGNIHRSAPSVPVEVDISASMTSTNSVTLNIPTLRVTSKLPPNQVRIVIYRWSTANQQYYRITSINTPLQNNTTVDSVTYLDTQADASIIGNDLIYTTGGVIENISPPASSALTLYKSRFWLVDSEDPNLLWYSKQVIENTPIEMSDLLTVYVAPTTGAQGSTGPNTALSAMDDKLIMFKKDAIYYLTGTGPDNTGANNDFSDPIFITSTVGCNNPFSTVFMPNGIMFQSDKGIWLLGRDLSTSYIGASVEQFNSATVLSAINVPGTNQVRFTLDNGVTLMYDYFYGQWGTFNGIPAISSTLYQGLHTFLDQYGRIFQESPGLYLDGSRPVLMSFTTGWMNLAGLQGYERSYFFYLLGQYITPHKLNIQIAYDYNPSPTQVSTISPTNFTPPFGGDTLYGGTSPYGGSDGTEWNRVFLQKQKCTAFQINLNEVYDPTFGVQAGAGFTLSGINMVVAKKSGYPRLAPRLSVG